MHNSLTLLTDLYQLTMAYGYWKTGIAEKESVFHLFFRRPTFQGGFTIAAGLHTAIDFINQFKFDKEDLNYLKTLQDAEGTPLFSQAFLDYLENMHFSCTIHAVPEGTAVFPHEPLVRVQGPLIQCQLLESPLLNLINFPSLIATKAARMKIASKGDPILEFGMRRAQGIDGALTASRAAYIGGCDATSNVLAGKIYGIPVKGTHSHSWIMAFDHEEEAFKAFATCYPSNSVFLVDTYDTIEGIKKAIEVGKWLQSQGKKMAGIRLDSGDLTYLSIRCRELLDEAGFHEVPIVASNELDEQLISELKRQGAQITIWGVGTHLVTGKEQPALDGVYKLSAIKDDQGKWQYKLKLSEQMTKVSNPGILQIRRYSNAQGFLADAIYDVGTDLTQCDCSIVDPLDATKIRTLRKQLASEDLLVPIYQEGVQVYTPPPLEESRLRTQQQLQKLPTGVKRFINPHLYFVGLEKSLYDIKIELIKKVRIPSSE